MAAKPPEPPGAKKQKQKKAELSASAAGEAADENPFEKLSDMLVVEVAVALVGPEADVDSLRCLACVYRFYALRALSPATAQPEVPGTHASPHRRAPSPK